MNSACLFDTSIDLTREQRLTCIKNADCPEFMGCSIKAKICISLANECMKDSQNQLIPVSDGNGCKLPSNQDGICLAGNCVVSTCGDAFRDLKNEECDLGDLNHNTNSLCTLECKKPKCGDGFLQLGEACDDGNQDNSDFCTNTCILSSCGDGIRQLDEACDDGNQDNSDFCTNACLERKCGDGFLQLGEACDDGNQDNSDFCTNTCNLPSCGDGFLQPGEICDGFKTLLDYHKKTPSEEMSSERRELEDDEKCRSDCQKIEWCGDGVVDTEEQCDDGNLNPFDRCDRCNTQKWDVSILARESSAPNEIYSELFKFPIKSVFVSEMEDIYFAQDCVVYKYSKMENQLASLTIDPCLRSLLDVPANSSDINADHIISEIFVENTNIYFTDLNYQAIYKIEEAVEFQNSSIERIAGVEGYSSEVHSNYNEDGLLATEVIISRPESLFVENGKVYFFEGQQNLYLSIDEQGRLETILGKNVEYIYNSAGEIVGEDIQFPGVEPMHAIQYKDGKFYYINLIEQSLKVISSEGIISTILLPNEQQNSCLGGYYSWSEDTQIVFLEEDILIKSLTYSRICRVNLNGEVSVFTGIDGFGTWSGNGFSGDGGPKENALYWYIKGLQQRDKNVYVWDSGNRRVRKISSSGIVSSIFSRDIFNEGKLSKINYKSVRVLERVNNDILLSAGESSQRNGGYDIFLDRVYLLNFLEQTSQAVIGYEGGFSFGEDPLKNDIGNNRAYYSQLIRNAAGLAFDGDRTLYISEQDKGTILAVDMPNIAEPQGWSVRLLVGNSDNYYNPKHVDGDFSVARFYFPSGLAYDINNNTLYVVDEGNWSIETSSTLRAIKLNEQRVETLYGACEGPVEHQLSQICPVPSEGLNRVPFSSLDRASDIVVAQDSSIYVSDTYKNRIVRITADGDFSVVLGFGEEAASAGDGAPAKYFPVDRPEGIDIDSFGNLIVTSSKTVRMLLANDQGIVDGEGEVITIYGQSPRREFPQNATKCLSGLVVRKDGVLNFTDTCEDLLLELNLNPIINEQ